VVSSGSRRQRAGEASGFRSNDCLYLTRSRDVCTFSVYGTIFRRGTTQRRFWFRRIERGSILVGPVVKLTNLIQTRGSFQSHFPQQDSAELEGFQYRTPSGPSLSSFGSPFRYSKTASFDIQSLECEPRLLAGIRLFENNDVPIEPVLLQALS
jgi:hypothetical protein